MKVLCLTLLTVLLKANSEFTQEEQAGLNKHNEFRHKHQVPPLTLDRAMCDEAKAYAEEIAQLGALQHSPSSDGENLSMGCSTNGGQTVEQAVTKWYNEVCDPGYDFTAEPPTQSGSGTTGHFTQVVWKGSTELGIGRAEVEKVIQNFTMQCAYIVGRYRPAGNVKGNYLRNVQKGNYDPSYCEGVSSKRGKFFDDNGTPLTTVDVPEV